MLDPYLVSISDVDSPNLKASCNAACAMVSWHKRAVSGKCFHETCSVAFKSVAVQILIIPTLLFVFRTEINHEVEEKARLQAPLQQKRIQPLRSQVPHMERFSNQQHVGHKFQKLLHVYSSHFTPFG